MTNFEAMILQKALDRLKISELNEMQQAVAKVAETGVSIMLLSPTGSGKTLAFLLPLLQKMKPVGKGVQSLILCPSRELALQIEQVFKQMTNEFKIVCCYGGHATKIELNSLTEAPAVIVGTPGRIAFHIDNGSFDEMNITALVLDEFDKSLEFGFQNDMSYIVKSLKSLRQTFLTSATTIDELPEFIDQSNLQTLSFLEDTLVKPDFTLKVVPINQRDKFDYLLKLLGKFEGQSAIIFVNFREATEELAEFLQAKGVESQIYHGGLEQDDRERALLKFRNGTSNILITTDLGARGLDIPEVENIIHFQMPNTEDAFIHRNGRTARMNAKGSVFVFIEGENKFPYLVDDLPIEKFNGDSRLPKGTNWQTLYMSLGKKDKINKVDIVGYLFKIGSLQKDEVGLITVKDKASFAAIKKDVIVGLIKKLTNQKIKGKKVKVEIAQ